MIFYLSCTGNTRWAARYLARCTADKAISIKDVAEDSVFNLGRDERIGFCFPVHGWRPSVIFRKFVSKLKLSGYNGNYCYALCTAGDDIGETIDIFSSDIANIGIRLDSACSLIMPESYVGLPFMDVDTRDNEIKKIRHSELKLKVFADIVSEYRKEYFDLDESRWPRINSRLLGGIFTKYLLSDTPFKVDASKCVHCGICAGVCPTGNITYDESGLPRWMHDGRCISCMACYHYCSERAIEYGERTKGKGQYHFKKQ